MKQNIQSQTKNCDTHPGVPTGLNVE